jgi:hypothetical protein
MVNHSLQHIKPMAHQLYGLSQFTTYKTHGPPVVWSITVYGNSKVGIRLDILYTGTNPHWIKRISVSHIFSKVKL